MKKDGKNEEARVNPIKITDVDTGNVYELDFNRDSIRFAESRQFKLDDVTDYPETKFPELFYYAFRKNHRNVSRYQTDKIYEGLKGFSKEFLERLFLLYNQAALSNNIVEDTTEMGNGKFVVEL